MAERRYVPTRLDNTEDAEDYEPGGFHPMRIGDVLGDGRYAIVHKLGSGGFSTVWLARDLRASHGGLVAVKVMRADVSTTVADEAPEVVVSRVLRPVLPESAPIHLVDDCFTAQGPNGSHTCLVSSLKGPTVLAMRECPGRTSGSRRLRGDLAKKVAKQTATAIDLLHREGIVHGDLSTANIMFQLLPQVLEWSDDQVYAAFGTPETEEVWGNDGQPPGEHAPPFLVAPIPNSRLADPSLLQEDVVVSDFGQSYVMPSPPPGYEPGTAINYLPPETRFEDQTGPAADVWALGCAIFEIRAGFPLFESFLGSDTDILRQTVETLGKLPDQWWDKFPEGSHWFEENGEPKSEDAQKRAGLFLTASANSIRDKVRSIGNLSDDEGDEPVDDGPMMEKSGVALDEREIDLLSDLLERILKYRPEERISASEILDHPWFATQAEAA